MTDDNSFFGQPIDDLTTIPAPVQQILEFLRSTDSFQEQPTLFQTSSLNKKFTQEQKAAAKNGLASTALEFLQQQTEPDFLMDYVFTTDELADLEDNDVSSLYAQVLGEYLTSLPSTLVLSYLRETLSTEAMNAVHAAESSGETVDTAPIAAVLFDLVQKDGREAYVDTLFYFFNFLFEHVMASALYGDVTPHDVATAIHAWLFQAPDQGWSEDSEESCACALSMMLENAGDLTVTSAASAASAAARQKKSPSLERLQNDGGSGNGGNGGNGGKDYTCSSGHFKTGTACTGGSDADVQTCAECGNGGKDYTCSNGKDKSGSACDGRWWLLFVF